MNLSENRPSAGKITTQYAHDTTVTPAQIQWAYLDVGTREDFELHELDFRLVSKIRGIRLKNTPPY